MANAQQFSSNPRPGDPSSPEPFLTMKQVAFDLNIPYYRIVRAVNAGLIPHHTLNGSKKYLRMSEVLSSIQKHGGGASDV